MNLPLPPALSSVSMILPRWYSIRFGRRFSSHLSSTRPANLEANHMLRLIHTADWHLGHTLHGFDRRREHELFINWLLHTLERVEADALLVAGDLFDTANPSSAAQAQLYRFLTDAHHRVPGLDIVLIAGNHDSPARLEAPTPLLEGIRTTAVGSPPRTDNGSIDSGRLLVPLTDREGEVVAYCAAVPFLRTADLPPAESPDVDPLVDGVRRVYREALSAARTRAGDDLAVIAMGHCYTVSGRVSELSERRVLGGNQHALPLEIFAGADYTALGHLHLAQEVAADNTVRYSGSPLPLSLNERSYPHQVLSVSLEGPRVVEAESLPVPRSVEILRCPTQGSKPVAELLVELEELAHREPDSPSGLEPLLEVVARVDGPEPGLREKIQKALADAPIRLARITAETKEHGRALADGVTTEQIDEMRPEEVFDQCYRRSHHDDPPDSLRAAFAELLESVEQDGS